MDILRNLADPAYVVKFQRLCGIHFTDADDSQCAGGGVVDHRNGFSKTRFANERHLTKHVQQCGDKKLLKDDYGNNNVFENGTFEYNTGLDGVIPEIDKVKTRSASNWKTAEKNETKRGMKKQIYIKYRSLHILFKCAAFMGGEEFFLIFFPYCMWNIDYLITRQTALVWCMCMYLGQACKDYLRWPRPLSPPVVQLESEFLQEFSMPSTHAMAGTAIPMAMAYLVTTRYEVPAVLAFTVAITWCVAVCFSRLYMGVHTIIDLLAGVVFALAIILVMIPYMDDLDHYQQRSPFAPLLTLVTGVVMCTVCYPSNKHTNQAKENAIQIVASTVGMSIGMWINFQYGYTVVHENKQSYSIEAPTFMFLIVSLTRLIIGGSIVVLTKMVMKRLCVRVASYMIGLDRPDAKHPSVGSSYKFVTFFTLGLFITWIIPIVHRYVGLGRPGLQAEVL